MRIRLVRHGEPTFDTSMKIGREELPAALKRYEQSTVSSCTGGTVEHLALGNYGCSATQATLTVVEAIFAAPTGDVDAVAAEFVGGESPTI